MATMPALNYPSSETTQQTHTPGIFSPVFPPINYAGSTYSASTQSPPTSPLNYHPRKTQLPPATDSLIGRSIPDTQPSLTARLHRRKKTYTPPTAPAEHASQPHDPLRAARLAWRLQEEYAEQLRHEEQEMRRSTGSFTRQWQSSQREYGSRTTTTGTSGPGQRTKSTSRKKGFKSRWQAFCLWVSLEYYRFTRKVRNIFKWLWELRRAWMGFGRGFWVDISLGEGKTLRLWRHSRIIARSYSFLRWAYSSITVFVSYTHYAPFPRFRYLGPRHLASPYHPSHRPPYHARVFIVKSRRCSLPFNFVYSSFRCVLFDTYGSCTD